ncbi:MAG: ABC transporter permease [Clostridia bacterium]|nr:ABC transporter permease [Clostridia bacterium]
MRSKIFSVRNFKEILRDPVNISLGLAFPLIILLLLWFINRNIPAQARMELYQVENLIPGIAVFGYSFICLFSATLISKDRSTAFLARLYASPMRPRDYIFGYTAPMLPVAFAQTIICYAAAVLLGLKLNGFALLSVAAQLPTAAMFIFLGLLAGSLFNDKQVGGICGALLTNLCGWLSGTWFDLSLIGGAFKKAAYCLPFANAVDVGRLALYGSFGAEFRQKLSVVCAYALVIGALSVFSFRCKMKAQ